MLALFNHKHYTCGERLGSAPRNKPVALPIDFPLTYQLPVRRYLMREIELTQGEVTIVDDEDFEVLNAFKWFAHKRRGKYYVGRNGGKYPHRVMLHMHRIIMDCPKEMQIDHKNGNGLDNRKENLRICTNAENQQNKRKNKTAISGYKGIRWHKRDHRWQARIKVNGKSKHLGYFTSKRRSYSLQ